MPPPDQLRETALAIAAVQRPDGFIPHTVTGAGDTWNHVEAAMGLDAAGLAAEAERAYLWLAGRQRPDGSWAMGYQEGEVSDPAADANFCAYVATGAWHHYLATGDRPFLAHLWKAIERALTFTLRLQAPGGEVHWARDASGRPYPAALLTSSSCIHLSLSCGMAIADTLGRHARDWEAARARLANAVASRPDAFLPKDRWAMDWYYPILAGVLTGPAAEERLREGWDRFVIPGRGVRCVADRPWVTVAESCELVLVLEGLGWDEEASDLFESVQSLRAPGGAYWTGATVPDGTVWPEEQPTWTSGAVLLAADALSGDSRCGGLFRPGFLETVA